MRLASPALQHPSRTGQGARTAWDESSSIDLRCGRRSHLLVGIQAGGATMMKAELGTGPHTWSTQGTPLLAALRRRAHRV